MFQRIYGILYTSSSTCKRTETWLEGKFSKSKNIGQNDSGNCISSQILEHGHVCRNGLNAYFIEINKIIFVGANAILSIKTRRGRIEEMHGPNFLT